MLQGFVMIGRGELLLSLFAIGLCMAVVGYAVGQIRLMTQKPEPLKLRPMTPERRAAVDKVLRQMCTSAHCDDTKQMNEWLERNRFSLITNEILGEMQTTILSMRGIASPEVLASTSRGRHALHHRKGRTGDQA